MKIINGIVSSGIVGFATLLTGLRGLWHGSAPSEQCTLYFANHSSHGDFVLLWAALPYAIRNKTRPIAGSDYWLASTLRRYIITKVFNAVLIDRTAGLGRADPVQLMAQSLKQGDSLIMFPEGTRNSTDAPMLPLKGGLYHLATVCPDVRLVPVWIDNIKRVLPKGELIPVPLACTVRFGMPINLASGETKDSFLQRARDAMLELRPDYSKISENK